MANDAETVGTLSLPDEVTVVVVAARDLKPKKKGPCQASVVFGIGKQKFKTSTLHSDNPVWNEESTFEIKANDPLKFKVRDRDEVLGQVLVPLSQIPGPSRRMERWTQLSGQFRSSHSLQGELCFEAWVSKGSPMVNSQLPFSKVHELFSQKSPVAQQHDQSVAGNTTTLESTEIFRKTSDSGHQVSPKKLVHGVSLSTGDLTASSQWVKGHKKNSSSSSLSDVRDATSYPGVNSSGNSTHDKSPSPSHLSSEHKGHPEVTGISPRSGPLSGGTRLVLRGSNLGQSAEDVIGLTVCGTDCLSSLEYCSPAKLICTTFRASESVCGPVVVKTRSGGKGKSTVTFTYKQHDYDVDEVPQDSTVISHPRSSSPTRLKKTPHIKKDKVGTREAELEERVLQLERHIKGLEEENTELKAYLDRILKKVMEANPGLLVHN